MTEPVTDQRVRAVTMQVTIVGEVITNEGSEHELTLEQDAQARYRFLERRLTGAGRDADAFRSLRHFETASARIKIGDRILRQSLPAALDLIVVHGRRSGTLRYSPHDLLTRDQLQLIDVPGDPLGLVAMLPRREVEVGEEWPVPDWAVQMLASLEAASTATMTAKLADVTDGSARIEFQGRAEGARLGAITKVDLSGHLLYDLDQRLIRSVDLVHSEQGEDGTINPGIDSQAHVVIDRSLSASEGRLTEELATSIPLEPPPDRLSLRFDAPTWGIRLLHGRDWHVFQANFDSDPEVVILRLLEEGTHICQCNFSPVPRAAPGEHTPLDEYEDSIRRSLGGQFGAIVARDKIPTPDGRRIFRVTAEGKFELTDGADTEKYPMTWIYYLCVAPSGKQMSFVFAVEPAMRERLAGQDRQIVESVQFTEPSS